MTVGGASVLSFTDLVSAEFCREGAALYLGTHGACAVAEVAGSLLTNTL